MFLLESKNNLADYLADYSVQTALEKYISSKVNRLFK